MMMMMNYRRFSLSRQCQHSQRSSVNITTSQVVDKNVNYYRACSAYPCHATRGRKLFVRAARGIAFFARSANRSLKRTATRTVSARTECGEVSSPPTIIHPTIPRHWRIPGWPSRTCFPSGLPMGLAPNTHTHAHTPF